MENRTDSYRTEKNEQKKNAARRRTVFASSGETDPWQNAKKAVRKPNETQKAEKRRVRAVSVQSSAVAVLYDRTIPRPLDLPLTHAILTPMPEESTTSLFHMWLYSQSHQMHIGRSMNQFVIPLNRKLTCRTCSPSVREHKTDIKNKDMTGWFAIKIQYCPGCCSATPAQFPQSDTSKRAVHVDVMHCDVFGSLAGCSVS